LNYETMIQLFQNAGVESAQK